MRPRIRVGQGGFLEPAWPGEVSQPTKAMSQADMKSLSVVESMVESELRLTPPGKIPHDTGRSNWAFCGGLSYSFSSLFISTEEAQPKLLPQPGADLQSYLHSTAASPAFHEAQGAPICALLQFPSTPRLSTHTPGNMLSFQCARTGPPKARWAVTPSVLPELSKPLGPQCNFDCGLIKQGVLSESSVRGGLLVSQLWIFPFCLPRNCRCCSVWNFRAFLNRGHSQQLCPCSVFERTHFVDCVLCAHERLWSHPPCLNRPAAAAVPVSASPPWPWGRQWWVLSGQTSLEMKSQAWPQATMNSAIKKVTFQGQQSGSTAALPPVPARLQSLFCSQMPFRFTVFWFLIFKLSNLPYIQEK